MALHEQFNITPERMQRFSPLDQLSSKYLKQVIGRGQVMTFGAGEELFAKNDAQDFQYYLLAGKLKAKKGLFSSQTMEAGTQECLYPINDLMPEGSKVKALSEGHMLLVDAKFLDRCLAWTAAEAEKEDAQAAQRALQEEQEKPSAVGDPFDVEHFDWMANLLSFQLFFNLPASNLDALLKKFEKIAVKEDEVIIKEGEEGDYFYLLVKGSARVVIGGDASRTIRLSKGSYFGEEALVSDTVRSATVIMNEDGELARLDKDSFQSLLHNSVVVSVTEQEMRERIQDANTILLDIRSIDEFEHSPMPDCLHIPLSALRNHLSKLDRSKTYYLTSQGGERSEVAAQIMVQANFKALVVKDE